MSSPTEGPSAEEREKLIKGYVDPVVARAKKKGEPKPSKARK